MPRNEPTQTIDATMTTTPLNRRRPLRLLLTTSLMTTLPPNATSLTATARDCYLGFDLGTSGARLSILQHRPSGMYEVFSSSLSWDHHDNASSWTHAVDTLLAQAHNDRITSRVKSICVSGTSASCLLLRRDALTVSRPPRMYNYDVTAEGGRHVNSVMGLMERHVPMRHIARAATGSLAKLLLWNEEEALDRGGDVREVLCHQSDYISASLLYGGMEPGVSRIVVSSDWHNCLKLGYDVHSLSYPSWMMDLLREAGISSPEQVLPARVVSPGEPIGTISPVVAAQFGLPEDTVVVGGTTDSNAAFFAAAGTNPEYGTAVTSLGSTLALKQLSRTFVEDASRGVYSHRFPRFHGQDANRDEAWLIGGASNVGCAILRKEGFTDEELVELSARMDPRTNSDLEYYPLVKRGERFPIADGAKEAVLEPKPESRKEYLHGILQGIGDVELEGYRTLCKLGATPSRPTVVLTCGGGSNNDAWREMRERRMNHGWDGETRIVVKRAWNAEASYGAALLAAASFV